MKAFAIISVTGGIPDIDVIATPVVGFVLAYQINSNWGIYLVSGSASQLTNLNATASVTGICFVSEGSTRWVELDNVITSGLRTKLNTRLTALGKATIPVGWTNRRVLQEMHSYFNTNNNRSFDPFDTDIAE